MPIDASALRVASLDLPSEERHPDFLVHDGYWLGDVTTLQGVVLPQRDASLARGLLEMGAPLVYLGESALVDDGLVAGLARAHGPERVGVYVPAVRMEVSWSLETESNADFKTVTPSICEPAWEILRADGSRTGTLAHWWLAAMFECGASAAIVRVDIRDDVDLNLCAALVEAFGEKLWLAPRFGDDGNFGDLVRWGKATRIALPFAALDPHPELRAASATAGGEARP